MLSIHGKLSRKSVKETGVAKKGQPAQDIAGLPALRTLALGQEASEGYLGKCRPRTGDSNDDIWGYIEIKTYDRPSRVVFSD